MIPGLLDSQIKTMSGKEIADRVLSFSRDKWLKLGNVTLHVNELHTTINAVDPLRAELASIIDSIREADRK